MADHTFHRFANITIQTLLVVAYAASVSHIPQVEAGNGNGNGNGNIGHFNGNGNSGNNNGNNNIGNNNGNFNITDNNGNNTTGNNTGNGGFHDQHHDQPQPNSPFGLLVSPEDMSAYAFPTLNDIIRINPGQEMLLFPESEGSDESSLPETPIENELY
jgi:hypothetical protein